MVEKTDYLLKLKTPPIGVKLVRKNERIPNGVEKVPRICTVCQLVGFPRFDIVYQDKPVYATAKEIVCAMGGSALGFYEMPEDMKSGERALNIYSDNKETNRRMMTEAVKIEQNKFWAIIVSPLDKIPVEPDIILICGNPSQMLRIAYGISWEKGDRLKCNSTGHMGICSEAIAATFVSNQPRLALPCYGAHRYGAVSDDEMVVGIPTEKFEEVVVGLEKSHAAGQGYPIRLHGLAAPPSKIIRRIKK